MPLPSLFVTTEERKPAGEGLAEQTTGDNCDTLERERERERMLQFLLSSAQGSGRLNASRSGQQTGERREASLG